MISAVIGTLWKTTYGKVIVGATIGAIATALSYPSVTRTSESKEEIKRTITEEYEKKLSEKSSELSELRESHTKEIERLTQESSKKEEEYKSKFESLTSEVSSLRKNVFTETVEIRRPDGTIEKRKTTHSTLETINEKVAQVRLEVETQMREALEKKESLHEKELFEINSVHKIELAKLEDEVSSMELEEKRLVEKYESEIRNNRKFGIGAGYGTDRLYDFQAHYYVTQSIFLGTEIGSDLGDKNRASLVVGVGF